MIKSKFNGKVIQMIFAYKGYIFLILLFLLLLNGFNQTCLSRDLVVYSRYIEQYLDPVSFRSIVPYFAIALYLLQLYYLRAFGFPPVMILCYISITYFTIALNQIVLSIALTLFLWATINNKHQLYKLASIAMHPSMTLQVFFNKSSKHKIINIKTLFVICCVWIFLVSVMDPVVIGNFLADMPQPNISHFGYYLTNHYLSDDHKHFSTLAGFENVIIFAIISMFSNRWQPFFYELIAFQMYTMFGTIPQAMGFRMFEVFTYLLFIFGYRSVVVYRPSLLAIFAIFILAYKYKYVFGCMHA